MSKGRKIGISGRIQTNSYETKDGEKRTSFDVVAEEVEFLDKAQGQNQSQPQSNPQSNYSDGDFGGDMQPVDDKDIPF